MDSAESQAQSAHDDLAARQDAGAAMARVRLLPVMDREAAGLLAPELREALQAGAGVAILADQVDRIGQVGLQLVLSAVRSAAAADVALAILAPSPAFLAAVEIAGLRPHLPLASAT